MSAAFQAMSALPAAGNNAIKTAGAAARFILTNKTRSSSLLSSQSEFSRRIFFKENIRGTAAPLFHPYSFGKANWAKVPARKGTALTKFTNVHGQQRLSLF